MCFRRRLEGLECLVELKEFYSSHNGIAKIEGLAENKQLEILDLSNNRIPKIENIQVGYLLFSLCMRCNVLIS